ncbi:MAG: tyrosine-type recombinase/integrase [Vicinamibacterales bacterium]
MFDLYFCPRVVHRLRSGAHAAMLEEFLARLHRRGHSRNTIQSYVHSAEVFLQWLRKRRQPIDSIDETTVRAFACRRRHGHRPRASAHAALRHLLLYLRDTSVVASQPPASRPAVERIVADYDAYLHRTCGLAASTMLYRGRYAREFIQFVFGSERIRWKCLRPDHIQSFIAQYGHDGRVAAARVAAVSLRSLLRWLQFQGRIEPSLIGAVPRFPQWRLSGLPTVMDDRQLQTFLTSFDQSRSSGCRDYAMALCMVDLGFRVAEVADLTLDDLDEAAGTLKLTSGKSRRDRVLPMSRRVRGAVVDYLQRHRPTSGDQHVFLRHRVPIGVAVTRELVRGVMRRAYAAVGGCEDWTGTHVLRHTAATRLHRAGADLKRVADILGHRSIDTTLIYTKVDHVRLTEVALPWPGVKEVQS